MTLSPDKIHLVASLEVHSDEVSNLTACHWGFASCSPDKTLRVFRLSDLREVAYSPLYPHGSYAPRSCCFDASGAVLASTGMDGRTALYDAHSGISLGVLERESLAGGRACAFVPKNEDGSATLQLIVGAVDGTLMLWDSLTRKCLGERKVRDGSVTAVACTHDGNIFASGSSEGNLELWDRDLHCLHMERRCHDLGILGCCFSPDNSLYGECDVTRYLLASCGQDKRVVLWTMAAATSGISLKRRFSLEGHTSSVVTCSFSPCGNLLATGSLDKLAIMWNTVTGEKMLTITEHKRYVTACCFAPSPTYLITGSMDKTVKLWSFVGPEVPKYSVGACAVPVPVAVQRNMHQWTIGDVATWLRAEGLEELVQTFQRNHINGQELLQLEKQSLVKDLHIESLGLRNTLYRKLDNLHRAEAATQLDIPEEFLCPISQELMKNPVVIAGLKELSWRQSSSLLLNDESSPSRV
uniref:WD repeat, SAM and U-box domain-containing protein 1 n=1 Tax=Eptatretus burgeri TaxID=7764 RepID=A0A8C4QI27_EPTBU